MSRQLILGVITLIVGGVLYLLFRPVRIIFFNLTVQLGFQEIVEQLRSATQTIVTKMPDWITRRTLIFCVRATPKQANKPISRL